MANPLINKNKPYRSKKIRDSARDQSCVRCGSDDGTVVLCHYTGLRQHQYGKGKGIKGSDIIGAHLCYTCHTEMDQPQQRKSIEASEEFLHCVALTLIRLVEQGVLK